MKKITKHQKVKLALKIAGVFALVAALALVITGLTDFILSMQDDNAPQLFWCLIIGFPLVAVGAMLMAFGFRRETAAYIKNETMPVISAVTGAAAQSAKQSNICPYCFQPNDDGAIFCRHCGKELYVTCPFCGEKVLSGRFCNKCGMEIGGKNHTDNP